MSKVLIIEDDTALRRSIEQTLQLEGLPCIATSCFLQARRYIRSNFTGVILSDIRMPDHTGFEVLDFVQSKDKDLPVILLTGYSDVPTAMQAIKQGAYDFLEKPCEPQKLLDSLRRALRHRRVVLDNRALKSQLAQSEELDESRTLSDHLDRHEKYIIEQALLQAAGKVTHAAALLGIPRNTLYDRMAKLQLSAKAYRK